MFLRPRSPVSTALETSFQGLGLVLEANVLAQDQDQDQDLIQWHGCILTTYLPLLNWSMFTSVVSLQFTCAELAAVWMPANSDTTAADVDKNASMWA